MKHRMNPCVSALLVIGAFAITNHALAQGANVKVIGAAFLEAPPGRDKNLTPFAAGATQEKIEVNVVVSVKDRMLIDIQGMGREQEIRATGMLGNKTVVQMGSAEVGSFPKISADRKLMALTFGLSRLTDTPPVAVSFVGNVNVRTARSVSTRQGNFSAKPGSTLDFGVGPIKVSKIDENTVSLEGGAGLERISAIKFITMDGASVVGERSSWGRINDRYDLAYRFKGAIADGKMEATLYEGLETVAIPINITITRPY